MLISTTGGMGEKNTLKLMKTPVSIWGFHVTSLIGLRTAPMDDLDEILKKHHNKIKRKTKKFYQKVSSKKLPSPSLFSLVQFYMFTKISFTYPEILTADYRFYKDRINQDFYKDMPLNPIKKRFAKIIAKIITLFS